MKYFFLFIYSIISVVLLVYLSVYPNVDFPVPPIDAVQSMEMADTEDPLRRAYFTNYTREKVISHYRKQMDYLPTQRLNYPPEDAQTIIRDQTRSVYLEELTHPFRESVFINGFIAGTAKDDIWYKGEHFDQKITVRFVPNSLIYRLVIAVLTIVLGFLIFKEWMSSLKKNIWTFR